MEEKMICRECKVEMNHHANKVVQSESEAEEKTVLEIHVCPTCGDTATRKKEI
jgi:predicted RNA-binding Zn-ribbon protein involved in translation (DUF1610 family)